MKRIKFQCFQMPIITFLALVFLTFIVLLSCENSSNDEDSPQKREILQDGGLFYSGCKDPALKSAGGEQACLTLQAVDENYLAIKHFDAVFNCIFDSLTIDFNVNANVINVKESHVNPNAYCTCKYDIEYKIGPLEYGDYTINILDESMDQTGISFDFEFTENTQITFYNE